MSVVDEDALPLAKVSEEKMREIVQGTPGLQEVYLYCMQELQSLRNELTSIKASRGIETGGAERVAACEQSCLCAPMDPALWSTLPNELLQQIFSRLPLPQIVRLQCLSTEWKWNLTSDDSQFTRACAEANPKIFAMVAEGLDYGSVSIRLYDIKTNRWHSFVHHLTLEQHIDTLCAGDGGLVCIVSTATNKKKTPLCITVLNPLTRQSRLLPLHALRKLQLRMVQLVMDRDTKCYKVIVVGEKKRRAGRSGGVVAKIFSSETGEWSSRFKAVPDLIFGHQYSWDDLDGGGFTEDDFLEENRLGPCAFDCAGRQLLELDDGSHPCINRSMVEIHDEASSECYALVKDHLFVLHEETYETTSIYGNTYQCRRYCISEYQGQKCKPHWVKLKVHRCKDFERPPTSVFYTMSLYACRGFLLVKAENDEEDAYRHVLTWLYDLSMAKWQAIPPFPRGVCYPTSDAMFELQWDAIP